MVLILPGSALLPSNLLLIEILLRWAEHRQHVIQLQEVLLYTLPVNWLSRMIRRISWNGKKLHGYPYNHQQCQHHYQEHNHHSHRHTSIHRSMSQSTMLIIMWMHITGMLFFFQFSCILSLCYCQSILFKFLYITILFLIVAFISCYYCIASYVFAVSLASQSLKFSSTLEFAQIEWLTNTDCVVWSSTL